jgi:hypothetical protein
MTILDEQNDRGFDSAQLGGEKGSAIIVNKSWFSWAGNFRSVPFCALFCNETTARLKS